MNILFASSEVAPFAKTGGLADVAGSLPKALAGRGHRAVVVLPFYRQVKEGGFNLKEFGKPLNVLFQDKVLATPVFHTELQANVSVYFIPHDGYFDRPGLYGTPKGDYPDNAERFIFFCRAVLHLGKLLDFCPDVIHCHDWQTALIPLYLKSLYDNDPFYRGTRTLFTIHNLAYQGIFPGEIWGISGLPKSLFSMDALEFFGKVNFMKGGILFSDLVSTVSEKYAQEILTPEYGFGLDGVLRTRESDVVGILNGVDYGSWNPETDPHIAANFSIMNLSGKKKCKEDLLADFGIKTASDAPVIGIVSRLAAQKGFDILTGALKGILNSGQVVVLLGTGDEKYEKQYRALAKKSKMLGVRIAFDNVLSHKIEAGSDMFLMPSRYEPCGLNQMYSLKYGTIPIVRATGGLDDTIRDYNPETGEGNGFKFAEYSVKALSEAVRRAVSAYRDRRRWVRLMRNAMREDFSWDKSASLYEDLYKRIQAPNKGKTDGDNNGVHLS